MITIAWNAHKVPLVNGYGLTECSPVSLSKRQWGNAAESVGPPAKGVEVRIVGDDGEDITGDRTGQLWARSKTYMMGYYRDQDATAAAIQPGGWIITGDLACRLPNGELAVVGRSKEMIIRSGFNVYPAEVETAINSHPDILHSAVVGRKRADSNEDIIAFVQPKDG